MRKTFLSVIFLACSSLAWGGQFNLGEQFQVWNSNFTQPVNGWELWTPISMTFKLDADWNVYAKGKFGTASYTAAGQTDNLTAFTDTVVGSSLRFNAFSVPSVLNISLNIPTGDSGWENKQLFANVPTEFVNSRYQARGFGVNAMYGFAFSVGKGGELGVAAGYQYSGGYNPNEGIDPATADLKLGDTIFLAMNLAQTYGKNEKGTFRLSGSYFLTTQDAGLSIFRMGPSFGASYSWSNPKAFSLEASAQMFLPAQRGIGTLVTEPYSSYGPRFYLSPSYAFGKFVMTGRFKYVAANGYPKSSAYYAGVGGGGFMAGLEPSLFVDLDKESGLRFTASYDYISDNDADTISFLDGIYNRFTFGTNYEVKW